MTIRKILKLGIIFIRHKLNLYIKTVVLKFEIGIYDTFSPVETWPKKALPGNCLLKTTRYTS